MKASSSTVLAPVTGPLIAFCCGVRAEALPADVLHHARRHLIDTLAAIVAGSAEELTRKVAATLQRWQGDGGGWAIPGLTQTAGLLDAAYITGVAAHGTETDDGYRRGSLHPGAVVLPALLGLAASRKASGARLLEALVVGYQAIGSISAMAHPKLRRRGFHPTSAIGPLGAALAVSRLLELDAQASSNALGIAASAGAGLFAFKAGGADVKRLHVGHAAREGLLAALNAEAGVSGPPAVLEGSDGFFQAFAGIEQIDHLPLPPELPYTITDCYVKPYACCRHLHPAMDAAMALVAREHIQPDEIEAIEVETYSIAADHAEVPWASFAEAQLSFRYCLATATRGGKLDVSGFADAAARNDAITNRLCERITIRATAAMDQRYPNERPAQVTLHTARGSFTEDRGEARGAPEMPLSDAEIGSKFMDLAGPVLGAQAASAMLERLWAVEREADLSPLLGALSPVR